MVSAKQLKKAHEYDFRKVFRPKAFVAVRGFDFSKLSKISKFSRKTLEDFLEAFKTTGFQATNLGLAIDIARKMRKETKIVLTFTSNLVTSGLRDIIAWLVKNKKVYAICTTAGGIEEDIMKCFEPFVLGSFEADAKELYIRGFNRTGNIYVSDAAYIKFEKFLLRILERLYQRQKKDGKIASSQDLIKEIGKEIAKHKNAKESILYWAYKNDIAVFCPAILDGAIGDIVWFFKHSHKDFQLDVSEDLFSMNNLPIEARDVGIIALGSGVARHYVLNANIFAGGAKYAIFINSQVEWDGSTSSSKPNEAYTWGKIKLFKPFEKNSVEVFGDATIIFPLLVAGAFLD
jgi:deoxyhypusine synthase